MIEVQFPETDFRLKEEGGKQYIFDPIRKVWLQLTDEEWVRQNFVAYLVSVLQYPSTLIALEKEIMLNGLKKRFDMLVYDSSHKPWMMIECKSHDIPLTRPVLDQVLRYNMSVPVEYIVITNGKNTMGWKREPLTELQELPVFNR